MGRRSEKRGGRCWQWGSGVRGRVACPLCNTSALRWRLYEPDLSLKNATASKMPARPRRETWIPPQVGCLKMPPFARLNWNGQDGQKGPLIGPKPKMDSARKKPPKTPALICSPARSSKRFYFMPKHSKVSRQQNTSSQNALMEPGDR